MDHRDTEARRATTKRRARTTRKSKKAIRGILFVSFVVGWLPSPFLCVSVPLWFILHATKRKDDDGEPKTLVPPAAPSASLRSPRSDTLPQPITIWKSAGEPSRSLKPLSRALCRSARGTSSSPTESPKSVGSATTARPRSTSRSGGQAAKRSSKAGRPWSLSTTTASSVGPGTEDAWSSSIGFPARSSRRPPQSSASPSARGEPPAAHRARTYYLKPSSP
jgi:hypothetical protein